MEAVRNPLPKRLVRSVEARQNRYGIPLPHQMASKIKHKVVTTPKSPKTWRVERIVDEGNQQDVHR